MHIDSKSLSASVDLGSSLIKVFFANQGQAQPLTMAPQMARVQSQQLDELSINQTTAAEYSAWLQLNEEVIAVGLLATNYGGDSGIVERKQLRATYKVLAVLGVLREKLQLPSSFTANLAVMLPVTEYKDRLQVQENLKLAAGKFSFRGQPISVHLQTCLVLPEGFGLYGICKNNLKLKGINPSTRTVFVLMFGHRNLSVLVFQNGALETGTSSSDGPGFYEAVKAGAAQQGLRAMDYPQLLKALALKETKIRVAGQFEAMDVTNAVAAGTSSYWKQVDSYLRNALTPVLTDDNCELVISGGAAWAMQSELKKLFEKMGLQHRVSWASGLQNHLDSLLSHYPEYQNDGALGIRMADAFAAYQTIVQISKTAIAA
jgi:hypothetical protein